MTETAFLITMDESCLMVSMGMCVCGYDPNTMRKCEGELKARPDWCPLVPVKHTAIAPGNKKVWVEE